MIAHLSGVLEYKDAHKIVLDVQDVGYQALLSQKLFEKLPKTGEFCKIFIQQIFKEDDISLFAFSDEEEKTMFNILRSVSGIGPKIALGILSSIDRQYFIDAVHKQDVAFLTRLPGIGKKTAERLILELKDKLGDFSQSIQTTLQANIGFKDAMLALQELGYTSKEISHTLQNISEKINPASSTEDILKIALKNL